MAAQENTRGKVVRARARLLWEHPFFGHLALQMKLKEDKGCDTAWSDGRILAYNPLYAQTLSGDKLKGLIGHLVMHSACRHHLRRQGRNSKKWNMACDYSINWILLEAGLTLPDGFLDDPKLRGKTADEIYAQIFGDGGNDPSGPSARPKQDNDGSDGERMDLEDARDKMGKEAEPSPDDEDQDSPAPEDDEELEAPDDEKKSSSDPGGTGEVRDSPVVDPGAAGDGGESDDESQRRIRLAQAAAQARAMGDFPASLERLVEDLLHPKIDWRRLLTRFIQASASCDYAWTPPNRRYVHQGLYLPGMRSDDLPELVVAVDSSGSISARELDQFAAELSSILETAAMTAHILYCDSKVGRGRNRASAGSAPGLFTRGRGAAPTSGPPLNGWERQGIQPQCMIYLTDMALQPLSPGAALSRVVGLHRRRGGPASLRRGGSGEVKEIRRNHRADRMDHQQATGALSPQTALPD